MVDRTPLLEHCHLCHIVAAASRFRFGAVLCQQVPVVELVVRPFFPPCTALGDMQPCMYMLTAS